MTTCSHNQKQWSNKHFLPSGTHSLISTRLQITCKQSKNWSQGRSENEATVLALPSILLAVIVGSPDTCIPQPLFSLPSPLFSTLPNLYPSSLYLLHSSRLFPTSAQHTCRGKQSFDQAGVGVEQPAEVEKEDDMFEIYRKRMMLAYRFRPNPLVRITTNTVTMTGRLCFGLFLYSYTEQSKKTLLLRLLIML